MDNLEVEIKNALSDPVSLERIYRRDRAKFSHVMRHVENTPEHSDVIATWKARLDYRAAFDLKAMAILMILATVCWVPIRVFLEFPETANENLLKYLSSIFFACWAIALLVGDGKQKLTLPILVVPGLVAVLFLFLPHDWRSQSYQLAFYHSFLLLWCAIPLVAGGFRIWQNDYSRGFIEKTGEVICWSTLFLIGGIVLTIVSLGLFRALGVEISEFYFRNVVSAGLVFAPFLGLYFTASSTELKMSSVLAKVFAPLAAVTITVFLVLAAASYGKLFEDKEAFVFHSLVPIFLVAIVFLVNLNPSPTKLSLNLNLYLSVLSILFVAMLIPPTIYRILNWGITPNKIVILGIEVLLLTNVIYILKSQIAVAIGKANLESIAGSVGRFLPIYFVWAITVVGILPVVFGFK